MRIALQHQGTLLGLLRTGTRGLSRLRGLSSSVVSSKPVTALPQRSSPKVGICPCGENLLPLLIVIQPSCELQRYKSYKM